MVSKTIGKAVGIGLLICNSGGAFADADIAVQPALTALEARANVDLCVVVPQILIFGVGGSADAVAKLQWTIDNAAGAAVGNNTSYSGTAAPFTAVDAPAPFSTTATATIAANGGTGSSASGNQADLPVFLFSNSGSDVTITTSVAGGATGAGTVNALDHQTAANTIPISSFTGGDGGSIIQPTLSNTSSATTAHSAGIVNKADTWTYSYTPASIPASGTYEARVTYVASTP